MAEFEAWLGEKLRNLSIDEDVYLEYIQGLLLEDEGSTSDDLKEVVSEVLSGLLDSEDEIKSHSTGIVDKWFAAQKSKVLENNKVIDSSGEDAIKAIMEKQKTCVAPVKSGKTVDNELKQKMLQQYGEISDGEEEGGHSDDDKGDSTFVNMNAQSVEEAERLKREKQKKETDEKKLRDKLNREKEKMKKDERQEKEKQRTQKGERRR